MKFCRVSNSDVECVNEVYYQLCLADLALIERQMDTLDSNCAELGKHKHYTKPRKHAAFELVYIAHV